MSSLFLVQVTLLTGPPLETQVRVCDVGSQDSDAVSEPDGGDIMTHGQQTVHS